jgi:hypothetical protein
VNGVPTQSFSMATLPPLGNPNPGLAGALKQLSAAKYGKPKAVVEKAIFDRLATQAPTPAVTAKPLASQPFQNPFATGVPGAAAPRPSFAAGPPSAVPALPVPPKPTAPSFLDEWLAKQRATTPALALQPALSPARQSLSAEPAPGPVLTGPVPLGPAEPAPLIIPKDDQLHEGNVSSAQLDQQEIDGIASELKKGLRPAAGAVVPEPAAEPVVQAPVPSEGTLHLNRAPSGPSTNPDDTIFIDNDGKIRISDEEAAAASPAPQT